MKNKYKKLILSLTLSVAMILGAVSGLLLPLGKILTVSADYEASTINSYDFKDSTGWARYSSSNTALTNAFDGSSPFVTTSASALADIDAANKPTTAYDGSELTNSDGFMMLHGKNAPLKTEVDATDEKGKFIYQTDGLGNFVFEQEDDHDKIYTSIPASGESDAYVAVNEEDLSQGYKKKINVKEFVNSYYSYKTSSSVSLSKNSWYVVSAYVWTKDSVVSMYVKDSNGDFNAAYELINSTSAWKKVSLFIETSSETSVSSYVYFYFGSENGLTIEAISDPASIADNAVSGEGFAYIDHVVIQKISETEYNNKTVNGTTPGENQSYSARYKYDILSLLSNADFQSDLDVYSYMYDQDEFVSAAANVKYQKYVNKYTSDEGTTKLSKNQLSNVYRAYNEKLTYSIVSEADEFKTQDANGNDVPADDTFQNSNKVLKIKNESEKYTLGLLTPTINLSQFGFYKLTLFVKSLDEDAEATIKLISYMKDGNSMSLADLEDGKMIVKTQSVTGFSSTSDFTNDWVEVSFYIQANVYRDASFQIALLANPKSTVYFDNIKLCSVTSTAYSNASSATKFDMSPSSLVISGGITNGYFDFIKTEKETHIEDVEAPYIPANWTELSDNDDDVIAGIVSTTNENYTDALKTKLSGADNPLTGNDSHGVAYPRTNVLAIYAPNDDLTKTYDYGYKSANFTLSSSSVYKITFEAFGSSTASAAFSGKVTAKITYSDDTVASYEETITNGAWTTYTVVVRTGSTSRSCYLELGVTDAQGTIFFQKVGYTKLESKTVDGETISVDNQFTTLLSANSSVAKQEENKIRFADFDSDLTLMHSNTKVTGKDYYEAYGYTLAEVSDGKQTGTIGVIDTTADVIYDGSNLMQKSFIENQDAASDFALMIYNKENATSIVKPNYTTTLSSSSYYEISVYVKTAKIANNKGLTIDMDKISVSFDNINTGAINDIDNPYVKYTVFVKTGSSTISGFEIDYILGTESNQTSGIALISGANIKKFASASDYNDAIAEVDENDKTTIVKDLTSTSENNNEPKSEQAADNFTLATFFLVLSSILLAVALVIALVAVFVKKMPKHKKVSGSNRVNVGKNKNSNKPNSKDGFV